MPDLTIQGPNGKIITLESVDEVLAYLLKALVPNSVRSSTSSTERKKTEKANLTEEANTTQQLHNTLTEVEMSSKKN